MTKRIFLALSVDEALKQSLLPIVKKLRTGADAKELNIIWSPPDNWHITLIFLGDTPVEKIAEIKKVTDAFSAAQEAFPIHLRQLGGFPDEFQTRVLWAGVARSRELMNLRAGLVDSLKPIGFSDEEREFYPHLTLARLRNKKSIKDLISPWIRKDFGEVLIKEIVLYESQQFGVFSKYVPIGHSRFK